MIQKLNWDSEFFNFNIGKAIINNTEEYSLTYAEFTKSEFDLIYIFCPETIDSQAIEIIKSKKNLHDTKLTFTKNNLIPYKLNSSINSINLLSPKLEMLAIKSGIFSRFKRDHHLNKYFPLLYKTWIRRSINHEIADIVYGYFSESQELQGILTLKKDDNTAKIGLISVSEKSRGLGIGKALVNQAEHWCLKNEITELYVDTQELNKDAGFFYTSIGFNLSNKLHIFHLWK
jgi:dTDP-4-amino-4,6-dideoxy-D-galactose acyltransferase